MYIYGLFDVAEPDRIRYVGKTIATLRKRMTGHWGAARHNGYSRPIGKWLQKRSPSEVGIVEICRAENLQDLDLLEIEQIAFYRSKGMADLNILDGGGGGTGFKHSEEYKAKLSVARTGMKFSSESKKKMSDSAKEKFAQNPELGKLHGQKVAKLSEKDVTEIRSRFQSGESRFSIAEDYPVSPGNIWMIVSRKTWKHLP